jgi:hypothetical protein
VAGLRLSLRLALAGAAVFLVAPGAGAPAPEPDRPIVWIQAGHEAPREPGYRAQTGAGSGPFGSEVDFTTRLASAVRLRLRARGVDARRTPGQVTPHGARGAAFVSLHHDAPGGAGRVGHAIAGAGENWYRGEGGGQPQPVPYPDSAPHRRATTVSAGVETRSRETATRVAVRLARVHTRANGARTAFAGVEPRSGNVRMMRFYGYYRTRADARILIECGAGGADDRYLARVDLIAGAIAAGVADDLQARGLLGESRRARRSSARKLAPSGLLPSHAPGLFSAS